METVTQRKDLLDVLIPTSKGYKFLEGKYEAHYIPETEEGFNIALIFNREEILTMSIDLDFI